MKNKIFLIAGVMITLLGTGIGLAVLNSYGTVTGYATVEQSMKMDIMGSSNDINYTISAKQGETKYSPQIKLVNSADVPISINLTASIVNGGTSEDVKLSIVNDGQNTTLTNPITVPSSDMYVYVQHEFDSAASLGEYVFRIEAVPN
ncbi:MAG: hypothetical protein PHU12_00560 [Candidatus Aenigmarchaeota archaeon]|nr:hypothetical protein [Candidatus Aenigmarchaeota archaeon]